MTNPFLTYAAMNGVAAFAASVVLTPIVRAAARRIGAVARPKADRWHTKPTAMLGGVAIVIAVSERSSRSCR
jgi:UDP-GlcNAc:undecaprenyl-phosphate GlcNAc-1-phosphate transferase